MIREALQLIGESYVNATQQEFTGNAVADFLRNEGPKAIVDALGNNPYLIKGSAGQSRWADVPWIAILDPSITTTATRGYYVVYLFAADMTAVHLCLAQGTTSVNEEFKPKQKAREELSRLSDLMRSRLPEAVETFSATAISLGGKSDLALDYEPSIALSKSYYFSNLPDEEQLRLDLQELLVLYAKLNARGGRENFEDQTGNDAADMEGSTIEERRRYRQHRKIERAGNAAKLVKKAHGCVCQGCRMDFGVIYGAAGKDYIEAHHLIPLNELPEDVPVKLDPKEDFAVLCANCHRMIHRKNGPKTIAALIEIPGVQEMRKLFSALSLELAKKI